MSPYSSRGWHTVTMEGTVGDSSDLYGMITSLELKMQNILHRAHNICTFLGMEREIDMKSEILRDFYWVCIDEAAGLQRQILDLISVRDRLDRKRCLGEDASAVFIEKKTKTN